MPRRFKKIEVQLGKWTKSYLTLNSDERPTNVEIGTDATQFPEKEYINDIFVAVWGRNRVGIGLSYTGRQSPYL
jgi:hypothetical protein